MPALEKHEAWHALRLAGAGEETPRPRPVTCRALPVERFFAVHLPGER